MGVPVESVGVQIKWFAVVGFWSHMAFGEVVPSGWGFRFKFRGSDCKICTFGVRELHGVLVASHGSHMEGEE